MRNQARKLLFVGSHCWLQDRPNGFLEGYEVLEATDREIALDELRRHKPAVVLQDLELPSETEGFTTLQEILAIHPDTKVIVITSKENRDRGLKAVSLGAHDFHQKPVDVDLLRLRVGNAFRFYELETMNRYLGRGQTHSQLDRIIAVSHSMQELCRKIKKIAAVDATVLLLGESGTGKEVLAKALHESSPRAEHCFITINCALVSEDLLERELFGDATGPLTGGHKQAEGPIKPARKGTLLLDEIGRMPLPLQLKLSLLLQELSAQHIVSRNGNPVDLRIICSTNQDLLPLVAQGRFLDDLYCRISEITLRIPPLREREGCRVLLARYFLGVFSSEMGKSFRGFSEDAVQAIQRYEWPGNVRELENRIKVAVAMSDEPMISAQNLGIDLGAVQQLPTLREVRAQAERHALRRALSAADGNISRAAGLLGVSRPTFYGLMQRLDLTASGKG